MRGVPDFGEILGVPNTSGVAVPLVPSLGGTGIWRSSGDDGIISGGRSGMVMLVASLL